jgi:hypothetical protein
MDEVSFKQSIADIKKNPSLHSYNHAELNQELFSLDLNTIDIAKYKDE